MSNRLEELDSKYKRYLFKKLIKTFAAFGVLVGFTLGAYFLIISDADVKEKVKGSSKNEVPTSLAHSYALEVSSDDLDQAVEKINTTKSASQVPTKKPVPKKTVVKAHNTEKTTTNYFDQNVEEQALEIWINKYNQKKSYSAAIYIAKQYYFDKNFKESGIWSKRANQLDREKEEAWLYYAKSVYALGDHTKAKKILNIFLQYKKSLKAELLLSEWSQ